MTRIHEPCPFCRRRHQPRYLCDPARACLEAMEPLHNPTPGLAAGDVLIREIIVEGALIASHDGGKYPALVLTGRGPDAMSLPRWVYAGSDQDITRVAELVSHMAILAIRAAR